MIKLAHTTALAMVQNDCAPMVLFSPFENMTLSNESPNGELEVVVFLLADLIHCAAIDL